MLLAVCAVFELTDRRNNRSLRSWDREIEIMDLVDRNRQIALIMQECSRLYGGSGALVEAKYRFWARALEHLHPIPGQRPDTALTDVPIMKRSTQNMQFYGRTSEIRKEKRGTKIRVALDCHGASPAVLKRAFEQIDRVQLRQMQNAELRAAGIVLCAEVSADGLVDLVGVVTDPVAMTKVAERAYTGCLVSFDGDVISDISLIDSPAAFMEKGSRPRDGAVICKIFDGGLRVKSEVQMAAEQRVKAGKAAVEFALNHRMTGANPEVDLAVFNLLHKATRPTAVGDAGLINLLRHGRP